MSTATKTEYAICVTRNYYGPKKIKTRLINDETGGEWTGTRAEAREKIDELDNAVYYTSNGESARAEYSIVKA